MPDQKENTSTYSPLQQTGRRRLRRILLTLTLLCLLNLLFTASIASLIGGIITLVMVWASVRETTGSGRGLRYFSPSMPSSTLWFWCSLRCFPALPALWRWFGWVPIRWV